MSAHYPARWYTALIGLFLCLFGIGVIWLIFRANGFVLLRSPLRFVKTGVISLRIHPDPDSIVYLNAMREPADQRDFSDLTPGRYVVRVEQPDFQTWEKTVDLAAGQALQYHDIILWSAHPAITNVTDLNLESDYQKILANPSRFQNGLQIIDGEIWAQDQLITRYSQPVTQAMWLPGEHAILAQLGNTIHAIDVASGLDFVLVDFKDQPVTAFAPIAGGTKLVVDMNNVLKTVEITKPFNFVTLPSFKLPSTSATM